jgi:hypothetical protein
MVGVGWVLTAVMLQAGSDGCCGDFDMQEEECEAWTIRVQLHLYIMLQLYPWNPELPTRWAIVIICWPYLHAGTVISCPPP